MMTIFYKISFSRHTHGMVFYWLALVYALLIGAVVLQTSANAAADTVSSSFAHQSSAQVISPPSTHKCFTNAKLAYRYLLAQEQADILQRKNTRININRASEAELASLSGIGSKKAQEIILYREAFGGFQRVEELSKVKGIGDKTIEKNRHRLTVYD